MNQLFNDPLFNITAIVGGIFFVAGFIMLKFPHTKINYLYGYRTTSSMKNQERWDFAQKYSAKEMMKTGVVLLTVGLLAFITGYSSLVKPTVGLIVVLLGSTVILMIRVEKAIKRRFQEQ